MAATHVLFESAVGYALYEVRLHEEIGQRTKQVQEAVGDVTKFGAMVALKGFLPFRDAAHALENANDVSEGVLNAHLNSLLELHLPKKSKSVVLGVSERGLAGAIVSSLGIECDTSDRTLEIIRGLRLHAEKLVDGLHSGDVIRSQLGLGHAYSRAKVKFNVNRSDNMIIQAIALLDQLDKDVNLFAMRVREWYGWHFPELVRIVPDNRQYAKCVQLIGDKAQFTGLDDAAEIDLVGKLGEALDGDETRAKSVIDAGRASMGTDISPIDLINIRNFADRVLHLFAYRTSMQDYLREKMGVVAPNLAALIGDTVGARLISHAGSLTNLSKYPASTVQILGAEKALFRALKTKGNTPKYGLIYHSTFIGRAGQKSKGRISRFLANKCSIASRIDCFADAPTTRFGDALRDQVEERLAFYETGSAPTRNSEAMAKVLEKLRGDAAEAAVIDADGDVVEGDLADAAPKKSKKKRKSEAADEAIAADASTAQKRKKSKSKEADTPAAPLSSAPPASAMPGDDSMDVDVTDKAARKAAKKARKSAAAAAIAEPSTATMNIDPVEADVSVTASADATKSSKKKKRKSEA